MIGGGIIGGVIGAAVGGPAGALIGIAVGAVAGPVLLHGGNWSFEAVRGILSNRSSLKEQFLCRESNEIDAFVRQSQFDSSLTKEDRDFIKKSLKDIARQTTTARFDTWLRTHGRHGGNLTGELGELAFQLEATVLAVKRLQYNGQVRPRDRKFINKAVRDIMKQNIAVGYQRKLRAADSQWPWKPTDQGVYETAIQVEEVMQMEREFNEVDWTDNSEKQQILQATEELAKNASENVCRAAIDAASQNGTAPTIQSDDNESRLLNLVVAAHITANSYTRVKHRIAVSQPTPNDFEADRDRFLGDAWKKVSRETQLPIVDIGSNEFVNHWKRCYESRHDSTIAQVEDTMSRIGQRLPTGIPSHSDAPYSKPSRWLAQDEGLMKNNWDVQGPGAEAEQILDDMIYDTNLLKGYDYVKEHYEYTKAMHIATFSQYTQQLALNNVISVNSGNDD